VRNPVNGRTPPKATLSCTVLTTDVEWAAALKPDAEKGCLAVVECYASWCGPSEAATNTLTRMSVEMVGRRIKFFQVRPLPLMRCLPTVVTDPAIVRSASGQLDCHLSPAEAAPLVTDAAATRHFCHPRHPAGRPPHVQLSWPTSGPGSSYALLLQGLTNYGCACYLPGTRRAPARPSCCTARRASRLRSSRCARLYTHTHATCPHAHGHA